MPRTQNELGSAKPAGPMPDTHINADAANSPNHRLRDVPIEPRGLSRTVAAFYVGISPSLFDQMVNDGRMPAPKCINSRTVWDRRKLDDAFDALPNRNDRNPWDQEDAA